MKRNDLCEQFIFYVYFYTIFPIPHPFLHCHYTIPPAIYCCERVLLVVTQPDTWFTPVRNSLTVLVRMDEALLGTPYSFAHPMEKIKVEIV